MNDHCTECPHPLQAHRLEVDPDDFYPTRFECQRADCGCQRYAPPPRRMDPPGPQQPTTLTVLAAYRLGALTFRAQAVAAIEATQHRGPIRRRETVEINRELRRVADVVRGLPAPSLEDTRP